MSAKIFFCGDLYRKTESDFISQEIKELLLNCDYSICNFEAPESKDCHKILKVGPHLNQASGTIEYLSECGFTGLSLANNHIYDFGIEGLKQTLDTAESFKLDTFGAGLDAESAYEKKIIRVNDLSIGVVSAAENEFGCSYDYDDNLAGYAWILNPRIEDNIRILSEKCDFVVVISHAGLENVDIPLKEWRQVYRRFCELGADVIVGHHPHVPQGIEHYGNSLIFYSLGNFYFDASGINLDPKELSSFSVIINFNKETGISFENVFHTNDYMQRKLKLSEPKFCLSELSQLLQTQYDDTYQKLVIDVYRSYYHDYYELAINSSVETSSPISWLKMYIKKSFLKERYSQKMKLMLLHNVKIDTHRFVVTRALTKLLESKND